MLKILVFVMDSTLTVKHTKFIEFTSEWFQHFVNVMPLYVLCLCYTNMLDVSDCGLVNVMNIHQ